MIAKHVPMRISKKSDFASLANYITGEQGKTERLGLVNATNCQAETMQAVISEVLATQQANTRAKADKTYHLLISFRAGEQPDEETIKAIEERICKGLGFSEHQRISALHHDTDNLHLHIAINKIHPTKNTIHEPYQAYRTLGGLCDLLENEYGLEKDNHQRQKSTSEGRAGDMERHSGIESLVSWIKRECLEDIQQVRTWKELHQVLGDNGLEIKKRGNGFVLEADDGTQVKASTVSRDLSKPKLEARLGVFEPSESSTQRSKKRRYDKRPTRFRVDTAELYAQYKDDQNRLTSARKIEAAHAKGRKDQKVDTAKRKNRLRRATIKLMGGDRYTKKLLYAQASASLKADIQSINKEYKLERQELYAQYQRKAWADWLKKKALEGDVKALGALRSREQAHGLRGDTIKAEGGARAGKEPEKDNITKKGTIIYRTGHDAVRDDGDKLQVSKKATVEAVSAALRLAVERYGSRITVNGTPQFKAQVIYAAATSKLPIEFADSGLERRRQELLTKQESQHERRNEQARRGNERRRSDRGSHGSARGGIAQHESGGRPSTHSARAGEDDNGRSAGRGGSYTSGIGARARPATSRGSTAAGNSADAGNASSNVRHKPNVTGIGREPPAFAKNRLRTLSSLGVVRIAGRSEVLLPGDVSRQLEHERTKPAHSLRRGVSGAGERLTVNNQVSSADKYITERESKRLKGFDIPKHTRYTNQEGSVAFGGIRRVGEQDLALLKRDDQVLVLPIDPATAQRMKKVRLGESVTVTQTGSIKRSKGRSR